MSVHIATGNRLDVVFDYEGERKVLKGLMSWDNYGKIIPLPAPEGLIAVLQQILGEVKASEEQTEP